MASNDPQPDPARGQLARAPTAIPPAGLKDIAKRVGRRISADRVMLIAAGVTYYTLLALVPALAVFVSLYGLFNDRATALQHVDLLVGILPPGGIAIIKDQVTRLTATGNTTLGLTLLTSLAVALWSASAGVKSIFDAMNIAYDETEKRNFITLAAEALVFTLAATVAAIVFLGVVVVIPVVLQFLYLGQGYEWLVKVASYALMGVLLLFGLGALYRWGPSRAAAKWRWVSPGALLALVGIVVVSVAFSWYAANFSNYDATYGSLGALVGLLTWIWLSVTIVIIGAELNAEMEHQTARDSTTGAPLPMGRRGAYMADHLAQVAKPAKTSAPELPAAQSDRVVAAGIAVTLALAAAGRKRHATNRR